MIVTVQLVAVFPGGIQKSLLKLSILWQVCNVCVLGNWCIFLLFGKLVVPKVGQLDTFESREPYRNVNSGTED